VVAQDGALAIHNILRTAVYWNFTQDESFHVPLHPLRVEFPDFGTLTVRQLRTFLQSFPPDFFRSRDHGNNGTLPIHVACAQGASLDILRILVELDPTTLQIPDSTGATPLHTTCGGGRTTVDLLRFLVAQGGPTALSARDQDGALPLHRLLHSRPALDLVEFLVEEYANSVQVTTNEGELPFVVASKASCSIDVLCTLLRAYPDALALSTATPHQVNHGA